MYHYEFLSTMEQRCGFKINREFKYPIGHVVDIYNAEKMLDIKIERGVMTIQDVIRARNADRRDWRCRYL